MCEIGTVRVDKVREYEEMRRGCIIVVVLIKRVHWCGGSLVTVAIFEIKGMGEVRLLSTAISRALCCGRILIQRLSQTGILTISNTQFTVAIYF